MVPTYTGSQRYEQAAQSILDALDLQDSDRAVSADENPDKRGVTSDSLWDALKTCCLHMQRIDLVTICDRRDVEGKLHHCFHWIYC